MSMPSGPSCGAVTGQQYAPVLNPGEPSSEQPEGLAEIFELALHSDPSQRFATAKQLAEALSPIAHNANCASVLAAFRVISD